MKEKKEKSLYILDGFWTEEEITELMQKIKNMDKFAFMKFRKGQNIRRIKI